MKNFLLCGLMSAGLLVSINSYACGITIQKDQQVNNKLVFNLIQQDGQSQQTGVLYPENAYISFLTHCDASYRLYVTEIPKVTSKIASVSPYGSSEYMFDPILVTGGTTLFYPSRFQPISK